MAGLFISYSRADRPIAERLTLALRALGVEVWWDEDMPGVDWQEELERQISELTCVVVVWTANSLNSRHVRDEARLALGTDKLINVGVDVAQPPFPYDRVNALPLDDWDGRLSHAGFTRLVRTLDARMAVAGELTARLAQRVEALRRAERAVETAQTQFQAAQARRAEAGEAQDAAKAALETAHGQLQRLAEVRASAAVLRAAQAEVEAAETAKTEAERERRSAAAALSDASRSLAAATAELEALQGGSAASEAPAPSPPPDQESPAPPAPPPVEAPLPAAERPQQQAPPELQDATRKRRLPVLVRMALYVGLGIGVLWLLSMLVALVALLSNREPSLADASDAAANAVAATAEASGLPEDIRQAVETADEAAAKARAAANEAEFVAAEADAAALKARQGAVGYGEVEPTLKTSYGIEGQADGAGGWLGVLTWRGGQIDKGRMRDGGHDGPGVRLDPDGRVYSGQFDGREEEGFGVTRWKGGDEAAAAMTDGQLDGPGVYAYAFGRVYKGGFDQGRRDGLGAMFDSDGKVVEFGTYDDNVLVKPGK